MITYQNYPEKKSTIDFSKLPKAITNIVPNLAELDDYHDMYKDDTSVAAAFDKVLKAVNDGNFIKSHIIVASVPKYDFKDGKGADGEKIPSDPINYSNYPKQKNLIDFGKLPKSITDIVPDLAELDDYYDMYKDDETIARAFDKVMTTINEMRMKSIEKGWSNTAKPKSPVVPFTKGQGSHMAVYIDKLYDVLDVEYNINKTEAYKLISKPAYKKLITEYFEKGISVSNTAYEIHLKEKGNKSDSEEVFQALKKKYTAVFGSIKYNSERGQFYIPSSANNDSYIIGKFKVAKINIEITDHVNDGTDLYDIYFSEKNDLKDKPKTNTTSGKIKLKSIKISGTEGYTNITDKIEKVEYKTWESANNAFKQLMIQDGEEIGGYKTKATVTFEDGETYEARMYLSKKEDDPFATTNVVGKHIHEFLTWMIENDKSIDKAEMQSFLDTYDLGIIKDVEPVYELKKTSTSKAKPKKESKPKKAKPEAKAKDMREMIPEEVKLLRRVKNLIGKTKPKVEFINLYKAIEKADVERRITKNSQYADELNFSLDWLKKAVDVMEETGVDSEKFVMADAEKQSAIIDAATGYAVMEAVLILKQFIKLQGRSDVRDAAQRLYDRIIKYETNGTKAAHYATKLTTVKNELKNYLDHKKTTLLLSSTSLSGIAGELGCCTLTDLGYIDKYSDRLHHDLTIPPPRMRSKSGMDGFGTIENPLLPQDNFILDNPEMIETEIDNAPADNFNGGIALDKVKIDTNTFMLPGEIGKFLGPIALKEYAVILKAPRGGGKSRLQLMIGNAFLSKFSRVDYFCLEMNHENPVIKKEYFDKYISPNNAGRFIVHTKGTIEKVREIAAVSRVVLIDSFSKLNCRASEYDALIKAFPGTAFIIIFQSTGDGTTRGGVSAEYDCSELISIFPDQDFKKTYAQKEKSRFTGLEKQFNLFEQKVL